MSYPTAANLLSFLEIAGFLESGYQGDLQGPLDAAVKNWCDQTGYTPFLCDGTASERRFNPPGPSRHPARSYSALMGGGRLLDLGAGIISEPETVVVDALEYARDDDYELLSENSDVENRPFTQIRFLRPVFARVRGIRVTAPWGYCTELPANVFQAILQGAASLYFFALPTPNSLQSVSRDGLSESFEIASTPTPNQVAAAWQGTFDDAVKLYRRGV